MVSLQNHFGTRQMLSSVITWAWIATLLISALPSIIWQEFIGPLPGWFFWARIILLAAFIILSSVWTALHPLRRFFVIFLVLYLVEALMNWIGTTPQWRIWFGPVGVSFSTDMLDSQLRRLALALVMIALLLLLTRRRSEWFLVTGQLDASAEPVRWLGIDRPVSWARLGWILALCISLGTLVFLVIAGRPSLETLAGALPLLPLVLVFAATNAFAEEVSFRAALLAPLYPAVGKHHAMLLAAVWFGFAHYYGVPYGIVGVVMAGLLGWLLSKSMLETKGFFWPWFIHFCQDVLIFAFIAVGSVVPGG